MSDDDTIVELDIIRAAIDKAEEAPPAGEPPPPDPSSAGGGGPVRVKLHPKAEPPPDFPVTPLGRSATHFYFLNRIRGLRSLKDRDFNKNTVRALFGSAMGRLEEYFPRFGRGGAVIGWDGEAATEFLMARCDELGAFDPFKRLRGRGAWLGAGGELVLHCGDQVFVSKAPAGGLHLTPTPLGDWWRPGQIDDFVYPGADPIMRPAEGLPVDGGDGPATELLGILETWPWRRGDLDARLLLGWIGAALIAGALDWRPVAWITGEAGSGKSTLHKLIAWLFSDSVVSVGDATAAGIWQKIGYDTLPVALDEAEAEEDGRQMERVIKLARLAASGALLLRGGGDHQGSQFMARSCFLFSSILVPSLRNQDRQRIALLELGSFVPGTPPPGFDASRMRELGRALLARLVMGWPRFERVLALYHATLGQSGHTSRGADQYGTLLACADLLLHDADEEGHVDAARVERWCVKLDAQGLAEAADEEPEGLRCARHLLTSTFEAYRGGVRETVGQWIERAAGWAEQGDSTEPGHANKVLATLGLKVETAHSGEPELVIATANKTLGELFKGTHWAGRSGASNVWLQALRSLPGAEPAGVKRFAGSAARAWRLPLAVILPPPEEGS